MRDRTFVILMGLESGASFSLVLTDKGAPGIGVQEFVRVAKGNRSAIVVNHSRYLAEKGWREVRKVRESKDSAYKRMYEEFGRRIVQREGGDSIENEAISADVMLRLEEQVQAALRDL